MTRGAVFVLARLRVCDFRITCDADQTDKSQQAHSFYSTTSTLNRALAGAPVRS
jgi:hypothetical protein